MSYSTPRGRCEITSISHRGRCEMAVISHRPPRGGVNRLLFHTARCEITVISHRPLNFFSILCSAVCNTECSVVCSTVCSTVCSALCSTVCRSTTIAEDKSVTANCSQDVMWAGPNKPKIFKIKLQPLDYIFARPSATSALAKLFSLNYWRLPPLTSTRGHL